MTISEFFVTMLRFVHYFVDKITLSTKVVYFILYHYTTRLDSLQLIFDSDSPGPIYHVGGMYRHLFQPIDLIFLKMQLMIPKDYGKRHHFLLHKFMTWSF